MDASTGDMMSEHDQRTRIFEASIRPLLEDAFGLAYSMLRDRGAAEDAVQEAAFKAWRGAGGLRADSLSRSWFFAIVANQSRDMRRQRRWPVLGFGEVPEPAQADQSNRILDDIELERALRTLPRDHCAMLFLRYRLDLSPSEIAATLHWRVGTVKSRLHRTLRKLAAELRIERSE